MTDGQPSGRAEIEVRALREPDLPAATRILQRAFGTFLGAADPARFMADRNFVRSRWRADPSGASPPSSTATSSDPTSPRAGAASAASVR